MHAMDRSADTGQVMMTMNESRNPYADIIHLPHHQAANRPHMSMLNRAAQFNPYAALVGFDGVIAETGRLTEQKTELSESEKSILDQKLTLIDDEIQAGQRPVITVDYFVKDLLKEGGAYEKYTGTVRKINREERTIVLLPFEDGSEARTIPLDDISGIHGALVDGLDDNPEDD